MRVLLCTATEMEIASTIQYLAMQKNHRIEVVITGVGLMTSTYALTKAIGIHQPFLVIQAGIAGTLDENQPLGEVVVVRNEVVGDLGVQESTGFQSLFDLKLLSADLAPWQGGKLTNDNELVSSVGLKIVDGVTVNEITTKEEVVYYYRNLLGAQIETMEGAALHYVALMEKLPFLQVRSISNFIGERDKTKWQMKQAIVNLNRVLQQLLTKHFTA